MLASIKRTTLKFHLSLLVFIALLTVTPFDPLNKAMAPSMEQGIEVIIPSAPLLTMSTSPPR